MHFFDEEDAVKHGILEAVLLQNIRFWTEKNKANNRHFYDDRYWTYNSARAFAELFPYASQQTIQRALKRLEEAGELMVGNYNQDSYNHTKWYSATSSKRAIDSSNLINRKISGDQSLTDINTDKNTVGQEVNLFDPFWKAYPRKSNKAFARKVFAKLKVDEALLKKMLHAIGQQEKTIWKDKEQQYIPHPSTWLNGERWEDEITTTTQPLSAYDKLRML